MLRRTPLVALLLCLAAPAPAAAAAGTQDVNGDGLADVAYTDFIDSIDSPGATVVFGTRDRSAPANREQPGPGGFRVTWENESLAGAEVVGDVNGDALADVLVTTTGELAVVFGKRDAAPVVIRRDLGSTGRGVLLEEDEIYAGPAGDVNGDGLADIVHVDEGRRRRLVRVRLGARTRPLRSSFVVERAGKVRGGLRPQPAGVGDVNGDRRDDIAVSVVDPDGRADGFDVEELVFVVFGGRPGRTVKVSQSRGFATARVRAGRSVAGFAVNHRRRSCFCVVMEIGPAGDLTGDRRGEIAITYMDPFRDPRSRTDVVTGKRSGRPVLLPGRGGGSITGINWVSQPAGIGDLTGDRRDDLLVGAPGGLSVLSGRRVRGRRRVGRLGRPKVVAKDIELSQAAGDLDGDGARDLLVGYDEEHWAIVYGKAPLTPVSVRGPGAGVAALP